MVVGANGTPGVCVLKRSMVYKQGLESVPIQNRRLVENIAMEPEQLLWECSNTSSCHEGTCKMTKISTCSSVRIVQNARKEFFDENSLLDD